MIDTLGRYNLLINWYVIGGHKPSDFGLQFSTIIKHWTYYKDNDWGMSKYTTDKTQSIFEIIEIEQSTIKAILIDLLATYKSKYPYSTKDDFINSVLSNTYWFLHDFSIDNKYSWLADIPKTNYTAYYKNTLDYQRIDFICDSSKSIEYYQQYAKAIVSIIDSLEYDTKIIDAIQPESKPEKPKKQITFKWQGKPDELKELHKLMSNSKYRLISTETNLNEFIAIFTGKLTTISKPIKWLSSNKLLAYFLDKTFTGQNWQSISSNLKLFVNNSDKPITANDLAVAKNSFKHGEPKGHDMINEILKSIQKH